MVFVSRGKPRANVFDFDSLYNHWAFEVRRWVRGMKVAPSDVEDLVQEIFVVAHRRFAAFDGRNPGGWLFQITRRKVRDHRRSKWVTSVLTTGEVTDNTASPAAGPDANFETQEKRRILQRLIENLNEAERDALFLFDVEGTSGRRIAEIQGTTINTVWGRIYGARRKLNRAMKHVESGWVTPDRRGAE